MTTNAASEVKTTSATLNGTVNPNGTATAWFRYDTLSPGTCNDTFGTKTDLISLSGTTATTYSSSISNLIGGRTYYFCAVAANSAGTSVGTVRTLLSGGTSLRIGLSGMAGKVGEGPYGGVQPIYQYLQIAPNPTSINADIATAEANDIVLMVNPSGNRGRWIVNGSFDTTAYKAEVQRYVGNATFADAVAHRRVLLYVADEPNIEDFDSTFTPKLLNWAGLLHKQYWPTGLTFARVTPGNLVKGWDGSFPPQPLSTAYTGIDYAWVQYSGQHYRGGKTFLDHLSQQRDSATMVNVGVATSLNMWGGGIKADFDGVSACWNVDYPTGSSSGYVVGLSGSGGYAPGNQITPCQTLSSDIKNMVANPNWIRRWADVMAAQNDLPFAGIWVWPLTGNGAAPWGLDYIQRGDFKAALSDAVNKGAMRLSWNGYRPAKPWQPWQP